MPRFLLLALLLAAAPAASAQTAASAAAEREVVAVIERLFDGMRAGDSTAVRAVFTPDARLFSAVSRDGTPVVQGGGVDRLVAAVGAPHDAVWDERILGYDVRVDDGLATAWTPYRFYVGDTFSHCGVNSFQLARTADGWKILQIVDTRRTENCPTE